MHYNNAVHVWRFRVDPTRDVSVSGLFQTSERQPLQRLGTYQLITRRIISVHMYTVLVKLEFRWNNFSTQNRVEGCHLWSFNRAPDVWIGPIGYRLWFLQYSLFFMIYVILIDFLRFPFFFELWYEKITVFRSWLIVQYVSNLPSITVIRSEGHAKEIISYFCIKRVQRNGLFIPLKLENIKFLKYFYDSEIWIEALHTCIIK